ncbi:cytochrome P450 [Nocardia panacis]|uniref:Cytochrome P450 n=1 Tax=Nocardia panacis TaxID=2340916 RepID=A0A3A4JW81_9NOCA|nr:cytochrome P450 [Nocardia panacis]RJO70902.1 cytochrome P450 [Nocardia panacis]
MPHSARVPFYRWRDRFDPHPALARLRETEPVSRVTFPMGPLSVPVWLVTRYSDVREVLNNPALYSNSADRMAEHVAAALGNDAALRLRELTPGPLVVADPPDHTRLRRVLAPEFTVSRMRRLRPRIEEIVTGHLDAMALHGGPVDLVESFALPVPSLVICELLGVPYADRADFQRRGAAQLDRTIGEARRAAAAAESRSYMAEFVRLQRADPGSGLLGALVREHGDELTDADLIGLGVLLLIAGHETTASMLALGTLLLLQHRQQWAMLADGRAEPDRAVEELLRHLSVVHHPGLRTALRDTVIGDIAIARGEMVLCSIPAANRDPELGPDLFDISRKSNGHLAFGHGIHYCVGAPLARLEMRIALVELIRRFPTLRLAVPSEELAFRPDSVVYGVTKLPVEW